MIDLMSGDELTSYAPVAFLLQIDPWKMVQDAGPMGWVVLGLLFCFSVFSWTIILAKWNTFRGARATNSKFLRAFRKSPGMDAVLAASEEICGHAASGLMKSLVTGETPPQSLMPAFSRSG